MPAPQTCFGGDMGEIPLQGGVEKRFLAQISGRTIDQELSSLAGGRSHRSKRSGGGGQSARLQGSLISGGFEAIAPAVAVRRR